MKIISYSPDGESLKHVVEKDLSDLQKAKETALDYEAFQADNDFWIPEIYKKYQPKPDTFIEWEYDGQEVKLIPVTRDGINVLIARLQ